MRRTDAQDSRNCGASRSVIVHRELLALYNHKAADHRMVTHALAGVPDAWLTSPPRREQQNVLTAASSRSRSRQVATTRCRV
jgi:hypothetical protein